MVHEITPPPSPTSSVESTGSPTTPIDAYIPTFVDDRTTNEGSSEGRFTLFKNSSEEWEEFKDVDYDSSGVTVADPGILISPSSSLLSGLDLLGGPTPPPLPEATPAPHNESFLDFPSPPATFVSNRGASFVNSRSIGKGPLMVSPLSQYPGPAVSCDSIPQSTHYPQSNALRRRWSALPPEEFHPYNHRRPNEGATAQGAGTFRARAAVTHINYTPTVPLVPFLAASNPGPGDGLHDEPPPRRHPKRQEGCDPFESFIDMSVTKSALSASRVQKIFSKISGGLKPRSKRRCHNN